MCHVVKVFITLQSLVASEDFGDKSGFRYNIIPLHPRSSQQPIMLLQEVWTYFYSKVKNIPSGYTICARIIKVQYKKTRIVYPTQVYLEHIQNAMLLLITF